jgi:hypothetical protein
LLPSWPVFRNEHTNANAEDKSALGGQKNGSRTRTALPMRVLPMGWDGGMGGWLAVAYGRRAINSIAGAGRLMMRADDALGLGGKAVRILPVE